MSSQNETETKSIDNWLAEKARKRVEAARGRTFVYFIGPKDGFVKIGKAKNFKSRLKELQTGSPLKLEILGVMIARPEVETALHSRFAKYRQHGEWFERSDEILQFIETNTLSSDAAYFARPQMTDELAEMKRTLAEKSKKLEVEAQRHVFEKHRKLMRDNLVLFWQRHIEVAQRMVFVLDQLCHEIREKGLVWTSERFSKNDVRTSVREMIGCDWREAERFLYEDQYYVSEIGRKQLFCFAEKRLRERGWELGIKE